MPLRLSQGKAVLGGTRHQTEWMLLLINEKPKCEHLNEKFIQIREHKSRARRQPLGMQVMWYCH